MSARYRAIIVGLMAAIGVFLALDYVFYWRLVNLRGLEGLMYAVLAVFGSLVFLLVPARSGAGRDRVPWYDILLFLAFLGCFGYLAVTSFDILQRGLDVMTPPHLQALAVAAWIMLLEALRRVGGLPLLLVVLIFSPYPAFAPYLPGIFMGPPGFNLLDVASFHILGTESVRGVQLKVVVTEVIGFILFGVLMQQLGGGKFFMDLALSLLGRVRGGSAKVSVIASALFGSISGSVISNVVTSGAITIPAMKRGGFSPAQAGAVESVASTGGTLMPPIMGAAAFIMAQIMGVSYFEVAVAALVPSILFYVALFVQIDGLAASMNLKGMAEVPNFRATLREGWFYLLSLATLIWFLFGLRWIPEAPYYASAVLILSTVPRYVRSGTLWERLGSILQTIGEGLSQLTIILAGVGFVMGSLFITGLGASFVAEVGRIGQDSVPLILVMAALASFVLGMGMTVSACYVFLAITIVPALVRLGVEPMAANMFALYWGTLSYITPPVALAAVAAAPLAGVDAMRISMLSMRLGFVKYLVPFVFVASPVLLFRTGTPLEMAVAVVTALIGVILVGYAFELYVPGLGRISRAAAGLIMLIGVGLVYPHLAVSLSLLGIVAAGAAVIWWKARVRSLDPRAEGGMSSVG